MDSFESVIASLLERDGFWTRPSVKVNLTKAEKRHIGRHSSPRWEIDLVAYKGSTNELWFVECKSYLDSGGINITAFKKGSGFAKRFKLFNEPKLFTTVKSRLCKELISSGACRPNPKVRLALAAGHIRENHKTGVSAFFKKKGWILLDEHEIKRRIQELAVDGYENSVLSVVSKMLLNIKDK